MKLAVPLLAGLICAGYVHPAYTPSQTARGSALRAHKARVLATAYCLHGTTATGTYTRPGTIAVDPRVIPLRSLMSVPGYGPGKALDTGGAIRGARVDLWYASCKDAIQWGARWKTVRWG